MQSQNNGQSFPDRAVGNRSNQATASHTVQLALQTCFASRLAPGNHSARTSARPCVGASDRPASRCSSAEALAFRSEEGGEPVASLGHG